MKKTITLLLFFILIYLNSFSQNLTYGPNLGWNNYAIEISGDFGAGAGKSAINYGGFLDYKLNDSFGLKTILLFNKTKETSYYSNQIHNILYDEITLKTIQLHTLLKFDVNKDYNKGFYFLGGVRFTNLTSAKSDTNENLKDNFFKPTNFGALLGIGTIFMRDFSFEIVADYGFTNTLNSDNSRSKNLGAVINLAYNIEPLLKNK